MTNINNTVASYNYPNYGPTFGNGHDIHICDKCNVNNGSYSNFPYSFNCNGQYTNGQASYTAFSGAVKGKNYKVLEY